MNKISFPGLGLSFEIDPTAFTVFGIEIQWYGIILSVGIVAAFLLFYRLAVKKEQIVPDTVYNITLLTVPIAIIGARIVYVVTKWDYYKTKSFLDMINIRGGGIAIYGAIIFGLATVLIYNKAKKSSSLSMLDALAPAVMLGQAIGRWGNFVNAEAYGWSKGVENLPWRMDVGNVYIDGVLDSSIQYVHPTFLYESLWNVLGLVLILAVLYRKKKFNGEIFFAYLGWYGLGRAFIELLRTDSLYIFESLLGKTLKFSVVVGAVCFIVSIIALIVLSKRSKREKKEVAEYVSSFATLKVAVENEDDALDQSVFEKESDTDEPAEEQPEGESEEPTEDESETLAEQDKLDGDKDDTDSGEDK